jgi:hypothetical protein
MGLKWGLYYMERIDTSLNESSRIMRIFVCNCCDCTYHAYQFFTLIKVTYTSKQKWCKQCKSIFWDTCLANMTYLESLLPKQHYISMKILCFKKTLVLMGSTFRQLVFGKLLILLTSLWRIWTVENTAWDCNASTTLIHR